MKGLFYFPINESFYPDSSIVRKNRHMIASAIRLGIELDVVSVNQLGLHLNDKLIAPVPNFKLARGINQYLLSFQVLKRQLDLRKYDFFWFRGGLCLPPELAFYRAIKRQNPSAKILLEYGSYPFRRELYGIQRIVYPAHTLFARSLKKTVSHIVTYCGQDEIYGVPCIKIGNGIDTTSVASVLSPPAYEGTLNLLSVSGLMYWHAYDRVIEGLRQYIAESAANSARAIFHIVGDSPERKSLERLVEDADIKENVIFHGFKTGVELDRLFDMTHLAIGTLGMHRKDLTADSSLKNREYFARGIPFVLATRDADFPNTLPFVKYVPGDDSPVNIASLVEFFENIVKQHPNYPGEIRKYAEDNLTWESKLRQVFDQLG